MHRVVDDNHKADVAPKQSAKSDLAEVIGVMTTAKNANGLDVNVGSLPHARHQGDKDAIAAGAAAAAAAIAVRKRPVEPISLKLTEELWMSTDYIFQSRLTWLLVLGPIAIAGDSLGFLGEAMCFACAGIALIPCAERYVCCLSIYTASA
jgi:hypothetical protein